MKTGNIQFAMAIICSAELFLLAAVSIAISVIQRKTEKYRKALDEAKRENDRVDDLSIKIRAMIADKDKPQDDEKERT